MIQNPNAGANALHAPSISMQPLTILSLAQTQEETKVASAGRIDFACADSIGSYTAAVPRHCPFAGIVSVPVGAERSRRAHIQHEACSAFVLHQIQVEPQHSR